MHRPEPASPPRAARRVAGLAMAVALCALNAAHAQAPDLASLFPERAPIDAAAGRYVRLPLPADVLAACRSDLSDLRVVDRSGREVPYAVDRGDAGEAELAVVRRVAATLVGFDRATAAAADAPDRVTDKVERLAVAVPGVVREGAWELVFATGANDVVRRVRITAVAPDRELVLVEGETVFRLARPPREKLRIRLPSLHDLAADRLTVELVGEDDRFLEPVLAYEQVRALPGRTRIDIPLAEIDRGVEGGRTTAILARPRGIVPDALGVASGTPAFARRLTVWDEGPGRADFALGRGEVARHPADETAERLDLALTPARGDRLRVVIEDGDSPPLEDLAFVARIRAPALVFALADDGGDDGARATLLFGGARAHRPRYDAVALGSGPPTGQSVALGRYDPSRVLEARLGEVAPNPAYDAAPALAFAFGPGAPLDPRSFRSLRTLEARPSADGLVRVVLAPEDLARVRPDLADVRIADAEDRQLAFLPGAGDPLWQELTISDRDTDTGERTTSYRIVPPVVPARLDQLAFDADAAFFDRSVTLEVETADRETSVLYRGPMRRALGDPRPWQLDVPDLPVRTFTLRVEDGDDAPLAFRRIAGRFATAQLAFPAPAGTYTLYLGDDHATAPRYELERIREVVLALDPGDASLGPIADNPAYLAVSRLRGGGWQTPALWAAIGLVVLVLGTLTLKLARQEGTADG